VSRPASKAAHLRGRFGGKRSTRRGAARAGLVCGHHEIARADGGSWARGWGAGWFRAPKVSRESARAAVDPGWVAPEKDVVPRFSEWASRQLPRAIWRGTREAGGWRAEPHVLLGDAVTAYDIPGYRERRRRDGASLGQRLPRGRQNGRASRSRAAWKTQTERGRGNGTTSGRAGSCLAGVAQVCSARHGQIPLVRGAAG
jgi:hypothetical protein